MVQARPENPDGLSPRRAARMRRALLAWFAKSRRALPWREGYEPYRVWISEMMLQQTQMETVLPYYERWMARFPDVASVARTDEEAVLKMWEGLGYYSRARSLHRAARLIVAKHGGELPASLEALRALPGIGTYGAGAIASIAFNLPCTAVDGNVGRVLARLFAIEPPINGPAGRREVERLAGLLLPPRRARDFNQALMELGALLCRPRAPQCPSCPLRRSCQARAAGAEEALPRKNPRPKRRGLTGAMVLLQRRGRVLVRRRPSRGMWGGLWEFPWLERKPGEPSAAALARLLEGLGVPAATVPPAERLGVLRHGLTHLEIEFECFRVALNGGAGSVGVGTVRKAGEEGGEEGELRWVAPRALAGLPLGRLNHKAIRLWRGAGEPASSGTARGQKAKNGLP